MTMMVSFTMSMGWISVIWWCSPPLFIGICDVWSIIKSIIFIFYLIRNLTMAVCKAMTALIDVAHLNRASLLSWTPPTHIISSRHVRLIFQRVPFGLFLGIMMETLMILLQFLKLYFSGFFSFNLSFCSFFGFVNCFNSCLSR